MLLFITSPIISLPKLCKLLNDFERISGLRVNYDKSHALNISLKPAIVECCKSSFKFRWNTSSIEYLGINLTAKIDQLYSANFPPSYRNLESELKTWAN